MEAADPDTELTRLAQAGDARAFEALVFDYQRPCHFHSRCSSVWRCLESRGSGNLHEGSNPSQADSGNRLLRGHTTFSSFLKVRQPGVKSDDEGSTGAGHRMEIEGPAMVAGRAAPGRADMPAFRHLTNSVLSLEAAL
jgi:hypothetical protein